MNSSCSALNCTNTQIKNGNITFHHFPIKNKKLLKEWLVAIKRLEFTPTLSSTLCSSHFLPSDFEDETTKKKLKICAVPSIFPFRLALLFSDRMKTSTSSVVKPTQLDEANSGSTTSSVNKPGNRKTPQTPSQSKLDSVVNPTQIDDSVVELIELDEPDSAIELIQDEPNSASTTTPVDEPGNRKIQSLSKPDCVMKPTQVGSTTISGDEFNSTRKTPQTPSQCKPDLVVKPTQVDDSVVELIELDEPDSAVELIQLDEPNSGSTTIPVDERGNRKKPSQSKPGSVMKLTQVDGSTRTILGNELTSVVELMQLDESNSGSTTTPVNEPRNSKTSQKQSLCKPSFVVDLTQLDEANSGSTTSPVDGDGKTPETQCKPMKPTSDETCPLLMWPSGPTTNAMIRKIKDLNKKIIRRNLTLSTQKVASRLLDEHGYSCPESLLPKPNTNLGSKIKELNQMIRQHRMQQRPQAWTTTQSVEGPGSSSTVKPVPSVVELTSNASKRFPLLAPKLNILNRTFKMRVRSPFIVQPIQPVDSSPFQLIESPVGTYHVQLSNTQEGSSLATVGHGSEKGAVEVSPRKIAKKGTGEPIGREILRFVPTKGTAEARPREIAQTVPVKGTLEARPREIAPKVPAKGNLKRLAKNTEGPSPTKKPRLNFALENEVKAKYQQVFNNLRKKVWRQSKRIEHLKAKVKYLEEALPPDDERRQSAIRRKNVHQHENVLDMLRKNNNKNGGKLSIAEKSKQFSLTLFY